ncbi:MAG TPA: hypothetical protein VL346_02595 [Acidobacteriaceae bacterium]|nr:hypothetical protein [Acidobacteriaceae bacterium]
MDADSRVGLAVDAETGMAAQRERKFWIAMGMYAVLAVVVWFTLGEGTTSVLGRRIEIRWIPLFVLGTFVFLTYIAREAEKIRQRSRQ